MAKRGTYKTQALNTPYFKIPNGAIYNPPPQSRSTAAAGLLGAGYGNLPAFRGAGGAVRLNVATPPAPINLSGGRYAPMAAVNAVKPIVAPQATRAYSNVVAGDNRNAANTGNIVSVVPSYTIGQGGRGYSMDMQASDNRNAAATTYLPQIYKPRPMNNPSNSMANPKPATPVIDTSTKWTRRAAGFNQGPGEELPVVGSMALDPISGFALNWRVGAG